MNTDPEVEKLLSNLNLQSFATRDEQEVAGFASFCANFGNRTRTGQSQISTSDASFLIDALKAIFRWKKQPSKG